MPELWIAVTARSHRDGVGPYRDGVLRVRVTRPPTDGEANRAVLRLVADAIGVAQGRVTIASGDRSRRKRLRVEGVDAAALEERLRSLAPD